MTEKKEATHAASRPADGVPDGWKLVPAEPTREMIEAGVLFGTSPNAVSIIYQSMIHAALNPPLPRDFHADGIERTSAPTSAQSSVSDGQCQQLVLDGQNGARRCLFKPAHGDTLCKRHRASAEATGYEPSRTIEPTPDSAALADTQRAIIEAAEARGYERAIRELSSNPGTQSSNPSALSSELDAAARARDEPNPPLPRDFHADGIERTGAGDPAFYTAATNLKGADQ